MSIWRLNPAKKARKEKPTDRLFDITPDGLNPVSLHQAFSHIVMVSQTGGGKTTGPLAHIAYGLLEKGLGGEKRLGGMVVCVKSDYAPTWLNYCRKTGREQDVIHVTPTNEYRIDIADYELNSPGGSPDSLQGMMRQIMLAQDHGREGGGNSKYFIDDSLRWIRAAATLIRLNGLRCSFRDVYQFIASMPKNFDEVNSAEFKKRSFACQLVNQAPDEAWESWPFQMAANLVGDEVPGLAGETRSCVYTQAMVTLDKFLSGPFAELTSSGVTNFSPLDAIHRGKIIILDVPIDLHKEPARVFQQSMKLLMQRAVMRHNPARDYPGCFLFADEAQECMLHEADKDFLTLARSKKCACINAFQNLPTAYSSLGGSGVVNQLKSWLGNHGTAIVGANTDRDSAMHYSQMFGQSLQLFYSGSGGGVNYDYDMVADFMGQHRPGANVGWSERHHPDVPPERFVELKRGGEENDMTVEAYVMQSGRKFTNGKPWIKGSWKQIV